MTTINFKHENIDWILVFRFNWEFSNINSEWIFNKIKKIISKEKINKLVFNFEQVDTINSRWAWWIASIYEDIDSFWWKLYITNMNEYVEDVLDLLWMFLFIWKTNTEKEALKLIK